MTAPSERRPAVVITRASLLPHVLPLQLYPLPAGYGRPPIEDRARSRDPDDRFTWNKRTQTSPASSPTKARDPHPEKIGLEKARTSDAHAIGIQSNLCKMQSQAL